MKKLTYSASFLSLFILLSMGCKKDVAPTTNTTQKPTASDVLVSTATNEIEANYNDLANNADSLYNGILQLQALPTASGLTNCRRLWINVRKDYEASEGYLFGPIVNTDIDPDIDTWPIDTTSVDSLLVNNKTFTQGYMDSLSDAMKGFHTIEFILYGPLYNNTPGQKIVNQITPRQFQYIVAAALNVKTLAAQIASIWNPTSSGNYYNQFVNAGTSSVTYSDQRAALEDFVNGMISICFEVGTQKIQIPYSQQNASLEESHFADNSLNDFYYNLLGLQNAYYGQFTLISGGAINSNSLSAFVKSYNISLDNQIKGDINAAIASVQAFNVPFAQAISSEPTQCKAAITACTTLSNDLQNDVIPLINLHVN